MIYEYECPNGHPVFEVLTDDREHDRDACPVCGAVSGRMISLSAAKMFRPFLDQAMTWKGEWITSEGELRRKARERNIEHAMLL